MYKIIKIDGKQAFFIDNETEEKVLKFDKYRDLTLIANNEDYTMKVHSSKLRVDAITKQITFEYGEGETYIVDDGYQDLLIRCGYIVFNDYDNPKNRITDIKFGNTLRRNIIDYIRDTLSFDINCTEYPVFLGHKYESIEMCSIKEFNGPVNGVAITFTKKGYKYTCYIHTINNLVNRNQVRKDEKLPFYPFDKNMDKFGTVYIALFCQKIEEYEKDTVKLRYDIGEEFIKDVVKKLNEDAGGEYGILKNGRYRFSRLFVNKSLNHVNGL